MQTLEIQTLTEPQHVEHELLFNVTFPSLCEPVSYLAVETRPNVAIYNANQYGKIKAFLASLQTAFDLIASACSISDEMLSVPLETSLTRLSQLLRKD